MKRVVRLIAAIAVSAFLFQPLAVTASPALVAQATATTGGISGTVRDETGAPVAGATVTLTGIQTQTAKTDATGAFQISDVPVGLYDINVAKPGYQSARQSSFAVVSGVVERVAITLQIATFTALHTIATVRSVGAATFNTSAASVSTVTNTTFLNQGSTQLATVLNEVPGLQVSYSEDDTNGAAPGAIQYANIRDGLSFETATEIDGHPLSVGKYGDYVLSFWTPFVFQSYDTIKGPGAQAAQTNYAINGTLNMRTLDPTQDFESQFIAGYGSYGETYFNVRYSGTVNKFSFVGDIGETNQNSPLDNTSVQLGNTSGGYVLNPNGTGSAIGYNDSVSPIPGTSGAAYNNYSLLTCCYTVTGSLDKINELLKLRYRFSGSTVATVSYLGSQATSDENGDTLEAMPSVFQPGAGYTGKIPVGAQELVSNVYPAPDLETSNEPMFQAEVTSTLGQDTVIGRYYHASIDRLITQGNTNPNTPNVMYETLSGTTSTNVYNDAYVPVAWYEYFVESENDQLGGLDLEYQHPYGVGDAVTASYSRTISTTSYWEQEAETGSYPTVTASEQDVTIPQGTGEIFSTYRLSDTQNFGQKFNTLLSLYENQYDFTAATTCGVGASYSEAGACELTGGNATFRTTSPSHFDERLGLTYRPDPSLIIRASAGSSIAPPYSGLLSVFSQLPSVASACETSPGSCPPTVTVSQNNPNLKPETAFGYDLGSDFQFHNTYHASADVFLTDLYNQFISTTVYSGMACNDVLFPSSNCGPPGPSNPQLYYDINGNVNNARYEGIELSLQHLTANGIGWLIEGSTQRGYAYDLGSDFYCSTAANPCTPKYYDQNLGIIAGENFNGGSPSSFYLHSASCPLSDYYCVSYGGDNVSNQSVPYLQGYAEINWQTPAGWYAAFGETLFGKNNSFNEPPFTIAHATIRAPLGNSLYLQVSGNNLFDAYKGFIPIEGGGVGIPLANGGVGPTVGNVYGPATFNVTLTKLFGGATL